MAVVDGEDELYLSYGQSEAGCTKPKVCEYIETRSVQIPFAVLHNATGHSLKLVFIGQKKVKIVEIPAPIIQEFLKQSGAVSRRVCGNGNGRRICIRRPIFSNKG
ncbi:MAG TPA: hypothetical protein VLB05_01340 [Dongiaceae bacterium]|nr:hypothetical protein [Dongiaceae bacterium]